MSACEPDDKFEAILDACFEPRVTGWIDLSKSLPQKFRAYGA